MALFIFNQTRCSQLRRDLTKPLPLLTAVSIYQRLFIDSKLWYNQNVIELSMKP
jgi:hypothetical protein